MSLTATFTLALPLLRTAASAGCSGVGVVMPPLSFAGLCAPAAQRSFGVPLAIPRLRMASRTAATAPRISSGPMAPMQPTRKVSTSVSLPG